jgi:hypothetical protein
MPDAHVATAYWYRVELGKFRELFAKWNIVTEDQLKNFLENHGPMPYSGDDNNNLNNIEVNIKEMVRKDFGLELEFSRHPQFDTNRFYPAPKVDQIVKDFDKEEYRRFYMISIRQTKYTLSQVLSAYNQQISIQEDDIVKHIQKPGDCRYQKTGPATLPAHSSPLA